MIATIQIGNSDDKLTQAEWSRYVDAMRQACTQHAIETHFFGTSNNESPWQNACWVVAVGEADMEVLQKEIVAVRKWFRQDSVAIVFGSVRMI